MDWEEWLEDLPPGGYEAVAATVIGDRRNASAVGVVWNGKSFHLRLFEGSDTNRILQTSSRFGLCFYPADQVHDLVTAAIRGYGNDQEEFPKEEYAVLDGVPVLKRASAQILCEVGSRTIDNVEDDVGETTILLLEAVPVLGMVRGEFMPIEMASTPLIRAASACTRAMYLYQRGEKVRALEWAAMARKELREVGPGEDALILSVLKELEG